MNAQGPKPPSQPVDRLLARELRSGVFKRQDSHFREWVGVHPQTGKRGLPVSAGRYHLYVSLACPWSHRAAIVRELAGLGEALPIHYVAPFRDERGWAFTGERFEDGAGGLYVDPLNGWKLMSEAYLKSDPSYDARVTVPVLWDTQKRRIVNNESSDIIRMFAAADSLGGLGKKDAKLELYPPGLRADIDEVNLRVYDTINNGVYNAGFARLQGAL